MNAARRKEIASAIQFTDLAFDPRHIGGVQATVFFPNGYGASVIKGYDSYGGDDGLYELAVLEGDAASWSLAYDTPVTDDVLGHLSEEAVTDALRAIAALPKSGAVQ